MLKLVVLVAVVALVDSTPYELVATGKSCNAANPGWKGSGSSLSACSDLVLADPDCVSDYFILATGDQNCRCASSKTANVDCSQSGNWEDDSAVNLYRTLATAAAETPTASQRANLKLADAHYVTNTKASIAAAELLYKQTVVEFSALFNAGSLLTKSAKMRYNYLLAHDSRKPAAEQALLCEDTCSPTGKWSHMSNCNLQYCIDKQTAGWCDPNDAGHQYARNECQKTCNICADKTPYAASELSSLLGRRSNDQCSDGVQNGDETGVDCGGSCSVCPVDCVSSETTCTCTPACDKTCDCTDTITITTPAAGRGQACPSATVRTFAGAACPPAYTDLGSGVCATGGKRLPYCQRGDGQTHQPSWGTMGAALLPTYPGSPNGRFAVAIDCEPACTNDPNCIGYNPYSHNGWCHLYFKAGVPLTDTTWTTEGGGWCNYVTQTGDMDGQDGTEGGTCFKKN